MSADAFIAAFLPPCIRNIIVCYIGTIVAQDIPAALSKQDTTIRRECPPIFAPPYFQRNRNEQFPDAIIVQIAGVPFDQSLLYFLECNTSPTSSSLFSNPATLYPHNPINWKVFITSNLEWQRHYNCDYVGRGFQLHQSDMNISKNSLGIQIWMKFVPPIAARQSLAEAPTISNANDKLWVQIIDLQKQSPTHSLFRHYYGSQSLSFYMYPNRKESYRLFRLPSYCTLSLCACMYSPARVKSLIEQEEEKNSYIWRTIVPRCARPFHELKTHHIYDDCRDIGNLFYMPECVIRNYYRACLGLSIDTKEEHTNSMTTPCSSAKCIGKHHWSLQQGLRAWLTSVFYWHRQSRPLFAKEEEYDAPIAEAIVNCIQHETNKFADSRTIFFTHDHVLTFIRCQNSAVLSFVLSDVHDVTGQPIKKYMRLENAYLSFECYQILCTLLENYDPSWMSTCHIEKYVKMKTLDDRPSRNSLGTWMGQINFSEDSLTQLIEQLLSSSPSDQGCCQHGIDWLLEHVVSKVPIRSLRWKLVRPAKILDYVPHLTAVVLQSLASFGNKVLQEQSHEKIFHFDDIRPCISGIGVCPTLKQILEGPEIPFDVAYLLLQYFIIVKDVRTLVECLLFENANKHYTNKQTIMKCLPSLFPDKLNEELKRYLHKKTECFLDSIQEQTMDLLISLEENSRLSLTWQQQHQPTTEMKSTMVTKPEQKRQTKDS